LFIELVVDSSGFSNIAYKIVSSHAVDFSVAFALNAATYDPAAA
jgi:hypothetical protein